MATTLANRMYPETHTSAKKRKDALITHPIEKFTKVAQQQKAAVKKTVAPQNAAKRK